MRIYIKDMYSDVQKFNLEIEKTHPEKTFSIGLRKNLIAEEIKEWEQEIFKDKKSIEAIVKESCDIVYVVLGGVIQMFPYNMATVATDVNVITENDAIAKVLDNAKRFNSTTDKMFLFPILNGILNYVTYKIGFENFCTAWDIVHSSNMSKLENKSFDENGKVQKGDYTVADLSFLKPKPKRKAKKLIEADKTENNETATN